MRTIKPYFKGAPFYNAFLRPYLVQVWAYLRIASYSKLGISMILISLVLPSRNIRCVECRRKRTMREQFVQIEISRAR
jgi:hypothetical protein